MEAAVEVMEAKAGGGGECEGDGGGECECDGGASARTGASVGRSEQMITTGFAS